MHNRRNDGIFIESTVLNFGRRKMFRNSNVVCAVEFGTSKICVLLGEVNAGGGIGAVLGHGIVPSAGVVVKGEIVDMERCAGLLNKALDGADKSSGGALADCRMLAVLVTGGGVDSLQNNGIATVKGEGGAVSDADRMEAEANAKILEVGVEREIINASTSYFLLDGRRVVNPLRLSGRRLEACVHIVHAVSSRIANFRDTVVDVGIENVRIEPVFSPLAAGFGVVDDREKQNGVLMVDLGAGVTEYLVFLDRGVCASGVIQLGMDHVANDLAIALGVHIDTCRKLLENGTLAQAVREGRPTLEFPRSGGKTRSVPVATLELIADTRLREIFELVRRKLRDKQAPRTLMAGGVLTGGGALYFRSRELFSDVFDLACRVGEPADAGVIGGLRTPRFSAVWGALKVAAFFQENYGPAPEGVLARMIHKLGLGVHNGGK